MHTLFTFGAIILSMFQASSIRHTLAHPLTTPAIDTPRTFPTRAEFAQLRAGSVYAGSGCISCRRTVLNFSER